MNSCNCCHRSAPPDLDAQYECDCEERARATRYFGAQEVLDCYPRIGFHVAGYALVQGKPVLVIKQYQTSNAIAAMMGQIQFRFDPLADGAR